MNDSKEQKSLWEEIAAAEAARGSGVHMQTWRCAQSGPREQQARPSEPEIRATRRACDAGRGSRQWWIGAQDGPGGLSDPRPTSCRTSPLAGLPGSHPPPQCQSLPLASTTSAPRVAAPQLCPSLKPLRWAPPSPSSTQAQQRLGLASSFPLGPLLLPTLSPGTWSRGSWPSLGPTCPQEVAWPGLGPGCFLTLNP